MKTRRGFLRLLVGGCLWLLAPWTVRSAVKNSGHKSPQAGLLSQLARHVGDPQAASELGLRYLAEYRGIVPSLADAARIVGAQQDGNHRLSRHLQAQQSRDYALGRTVVLDGWVLSQTEVEICALLAQAALNRRTS